MWREEAACLGKPTSLWFPVINEDEDDPDPNTPRRRETPRLYREAKRICMSCPVRQECLDYALENREPYGMWGGLTRPERMNILQARGKELKE